MHDVQDVCYFVVVAAAVVAVALLRGCIKHNTCNEKLNFLKYLPFV
jgi:outer membrane murein-binding lipoprotein Lpp